MSRVIQMAALYKNGYSLAKVGRVFHLSRQRVQQILDANGIPRRDRVQAYDVTRKERRPK